MAALQAVQQMCMHVIPTTASKAHAFVQLSSVQFSCKTAFLPFSVHSSLIPLTWPILAISFHGYYWNHN